MLQFEEIDKKFHFRELPKPLPVNPADCPVSGCFAPEGFGGNACYIGFFDGNTSDPVDLRP